MKPAAPWRKIYEQADGRELILFVSWLLELLSMAVSVNQCVCGRMAHPYGLHAVRVCVCVCDWESETESERIILMCEPSCGERINTLGRLWAIEEPCFNYQLLLLLLSLQYTHTHTHTSVHAKHNRCCHSSSYRSINTLTDNADTLYDDHNINWSVTDILQHHLSTSLHFFFCLQVNKTVVACSLCVCFFMYSNKCFIWTISSSITIIDVPPF